MSFGRKHFLAMLALGVGGGLAGCGGGSKDSTSPDGDGGSDRSNLSVTRVGSGPHNNALNGTTTITDVSVDGTRDLFRIAIRFTDSNTELAATLTGMDLRAGQTVVIPSATSSLAPLVQVSLWENSTLPRWSSYRFGSTSEGSITIEQLQSGLVRVRFNDVLLFPSSSEGGQGQLRISGTVETDNTLTLFL